MSSMTRIAFLLPMLLGSAALAQLAQNRPATPVTSPVVAASAVADINYALGDWRRLRASEGYNFADYARFLIANPGWPEEAKMRRWAEKRMVPGESAVTVISFFRSEAPKTGRRTGHRRRSGPERPAAHGGRVSA